MSKKIDKHVLNRYCIVRTYSAGVWYGKATAKTKTEVLLTNARRMYSWKNIDDGISLSHIALSGIHPDSRVQAPLDTAVIQWIELLPCTDNSILTFSEQPYAKAN